MCPAPPAHAPGDEEHELPAVEAVLAGTLALMTGYGQALQAEVHPEQRLMMGVKIARNLAQLGEHPLLSEAFQTVLRRLGQRWQLMTACTCCAGEPAAAALAAMPMPGRLQ
jgi:hypothetical protein